MPYKERFGIRFLSIFLTGSVTVWFVFASGCISSNNELTLQKRKETENSVKASRLDEAAETVADIQAESEKYILTPKPSLHPRINGPKVFGVRPNRPFLFRIPATGQKPIIFATENLPDGLKLDEKTGCITGSIKSQGTFHVKLIATNVLGSAERDFRICVGDTIALTPPMGWNSWNVWGCSVDEATIREAADTMISSGLIDHGWSYVNIDSGWQGERYPDTKKITTNNKFPDMTALSNYIHSKGMKIGIYTDCGPKDCGGYEGSKDYEWKDILTYDAWGIDYVKIDWCYTKGIEPVSAYGKFGDALKDCNRDIVYSICNWGVKNPWEWGRDVGGHLGRTTNDIDDTWESMASIGFSQAPLATYAGPGYWNDPDMLVVGKVGVIVGQISWEKNLRPSRLTPDEQYTHISLWCLLSAPLLIGCDMSQMDDFTFGLLTNDEVLEVDQDPLGEQARPVKRYIMKNGSAEVWSKNLEDGSKAVGLFNLSPVEANVVANWSEEWSQFGIKGKQAVRDLWRQKDLGVFEDKFEARVPGHGVVLVKLTPLPDDKK